MSKDVRSVTEDLLAKYPPLRDNDKLLLLAYWATEGLHLTEDQRTAFLSTTPAESVTRARRALRGTYPGSEQAEKARYNKFKETRDEFGRPVMVLYEK